jgi:hypothetical protein
MSARWLADQAGKASQFAYYPLLTANLLNSEATYASILPLLILYALHKQDVLLSATSLLGHHTLV